MNIFILLLCTLKKHGIKAVCIFDGPNSPPEKKPEQERRRKQNEKAISYLKECIRIRNILEDKYVLYDLEPSDELKKECKLLLCRNRRTTFVDATNYRDSMDIVESLNIEIEKKERQTLPITDDYRQKAEEIVKAMGLAHYRADGEAETLCAFLAINKMVDGVLTEDTDVLAYGTPLMIAFKEFKLSDAKVVGINYYTLLESLGYTHEEFKDLCILLSCDYNSRIKGYLPDKKNKKYICIGHTRAIIMINKYRRLENVEKYIEDAEPLKYVRCRELFTIPKTIPKELKDSTTIPKNGPIDLVFMNDIIKKNKLTVSIDYIKNFWKPSVITYTSK